MISTIRNTAIAGCLALGVAGCASWGTTDTKPADGAAPAAQPKQASQVLVTENDVTERKYRVLGEVSATVNKTTIFNKNPTREMVAAKLQEAAAKLGADAVIQVRYGNVGVSLMSWGSLSGTGRAVAFVR
jgi:uncharacterized protein YbjQ (UPF0145 family)